MKVAVKTVFPLILILACTMAMAQEADQQTEEPKPQESPPAASQAKPLIEEIVVTARKREESLQKAPVAISVITPDTIKDAGITNIAEVGARLPNVSTIDEPAGLTGNGFAPNIRGMRSASRQIGEESGLGIFIDGAYAGSNANGNRFLPPVERVEFLPGPQATMFGKNTTLGVMNVVTKKPGEVFEGEVRASVGNYDHKEITATVMGPVSDSVSLGLTLGKRVYDGFEINHNSVELPNDALYPASNYPGVGDGVKGPVLDAWGGAFQFAYRGQNNRLDVMVDHSDNERTNQFDVARVEGFDALPRDTYSTSSVGYLVGDETGAIVTYSHDLGPGVLTSTTSYREFFTDMNSDDDAYPYRVVEIYVWETEQEQITQELRWAQNIGSVSYLAGAYYQDQQLNMVRGGDVLEITPELMITGEMKNKTIAGFANADFYLSDAWGLELGVRVGKEDKDLPYFTQSGGETIGLWGGIISDSRSTTQLSYTGAVTYAVTDVLNTHFRYSRGFKSGGFTIDFVTSPTPPPFYEFDDEHADSFELGAKWQVSRALWWNTVLFYTDYTDLQVSQLLTIEGSSTPFFATGNAGAATTKGLETTLIYSGQKLTLNASVGYNDAYYTEWLRPAGDGFEDMAGRKMPSPRVTANLFTSYDIGALTLVAEYMYREGRPATPGEPSRNFTDDLNQINLRARYNITENLSAILWVRNVTDERAVIDRRTNVQGGFIHDYAGIFYPSRLVGVYDMIIGGYQPPRHYGLDIEFRF